MSTFSDLLSRERRSKLQKLCRSVASRSLDDAETARKLEKHHAGAAGKNYEETWKSRLGQILAVIDGGETSLPRALAAVARKTEQLRKMDLGRGTYVAFDKLVELPQRGAQRLHRGVIVEAVADLCSDETRSIIELGSGWGEHLLNLWNEGGPRAATYYACELAESGRKCALVLAALDAGLELKAPFFNYCQPDFSVIPAGQKEIVVFSVQSIEQVEDVPAPLLTGLCALAEVVKVVHFEPIGWQMVPDSDKSDLMRRHEARCLEKKYNRNYWKLLKEAEAARLIEVKVAIPYFFGHEHNPLSYLVWEKRR